ncbi:fec operon regulator FecR [compost metagenome]
MVRYGRGGVSSPQVADLETVQAWRHDRLVFRDVPLSKVVAELGRYRRGRIQILDEAAGNARVTAVFDAGRIDAALDTIAESFGFRIFRATGLLTVVTSR